MKPALPLALPLVAAATLVFLTACGGGGSSGPTDPTSPEPPTPTADFTIAVDTDRAAILQGGQLKLKATVTRRNGFAGAVQVSLDGLPSGVSVPATTIAAGASSADLTLAAATAAPHSLPTGVTVRGEATGASATRAMTVTVRGPAGSVDTSFAGGVVRQAVDAGEDVANAVAVQADGKLIVAGASSTATGTWVSLIRLQRDGTLDTGFGDGGKVITPIGSLGNDGAAALALQADGRIVVAGASQQAATGLDFTVLRYEADGTLDTGFGDAGKVVADFAGDADRAWALLLVDGKIVVGGQANTGSAATGVDFALLRLNADGTPDASFGSAGKVTTPIKTETGTDVIRALALQTVDGQPRLLAVGGEGDFLAARYRDDGSLDASFARAGKLDGAFGSVIGSAYAVSLLPDGKAVLAGHVDHRFAALQLTAAGLPDPGFATAGRVQLPLVENWNEATALARQADGKLVLGGWAYSGSGSSADFAAARLNADGSLDDGFGSAGIVITPTAPGDRSDQAKALVLQADDRVPAVRAIQAGESNDANQDFTALRLWL